MQPNVLVIKGNLMESIQVVDGAWRRGAYIYYLFDYFCIAVIQHDLKWNLFHI